MTFSPLVTDRHVVPRWRSLAKTVASGELAMPPVETAEPSRRPSAELIRRLEAWRMRSNTITAAEVVETAIVEQFPSEAARPARMLLLPVSDATKLVRGQAGRLLRELGHEIDPLAKSENARGELRPVALWRQATRFSPHDPLAWVELSLGYVTVGKNEEALRAMAVALQLAPYDRHVLRAASRLFLHRRDAEQAHDLLSKNPATPHDPWLMAGEIALSAIAERKPRFFKTGIAFIDESGLRPRHLSELASAIGTVHLKDGNRKARKLFNTSLIDPTGNSLAQAEWASPRLGSLVKPDLLENSEDSLEALVFEAYWRCDFRTVVERCEAWRIEEPYSSRPTQFGSGSAITIEDFVSALRFCDEGLKKNPEQIILRNNRAYALIATGQLEEGLRLNASCLENSDGDLRAIATATLGFFHMRTRNYEQGTKLYRSAIAYLKRSNNIHSECLAWAYFALEAARGELPETAQILEEAKNACKRLKSLPEATILLERAERWIEAVRRRNAQTPLLRV